MIEINKYELLKLDMFEILQKSRKTFDKIIVL